MGDNLGDKIREDAGASIGITEGGSLRSGKNEINGVPGGGRMRENSDAREESGVCFWERATRRFVPPDRSSTSDCGVMSLAKSADIE